MFVTIDVRFLPTARRDTGLIRSVKSELELGYRETIQHSFRVAPGYSGTACCQQYLACLARGARLVDYDLGETRHQLLP
jgi:hypothetical protein